MSRPLPRRLARTHALAALAAWVALASPARADTVYLKDGRVVTGRVIDRGDDTIFLERALGGIPIRRRDVLRIEIDAVQPDREGLPHDVVILRDGGVVRGDARLTADGSEVVIGLGDQGEVRHPRDEVTAIHWRDGRKEGAAAGAGSPLQGKVDALVADLGRTGPDGSADEDARATARRELLGLGAFARTYLASLQGEAAERVRPLLEDLDRLEAVRRVLPNAVEQRQPGIAERLIDRDDEVREKALRALVMAEPTAVAPLLLHVVRADGAPRLRALAVSQLASLRRFEELADVLRTRDGPLRLAAAFALGDAGVYAGVPVLIEALRLEDLTIRSAAVHKLRQYTRQHFDYDPGGAPEAREAAVGRWREWWGKEGEALVRRSIKEVAPGLEGARVSEEEAARADGLLVEAERLVVAAQQGLPGPDGPPDPRAASERRLRLERAQDLMREALALDPSRSSARMTRAVLLYEDLGRALEARQELGRIIDRAKHDPGDPDAARKFANYHLGVIALRESRWEKASLRFTQALQYDAAYLDAMLGQGDAYLGLALSEEVALADRDREDAARAAGREPPDPAQSGVETNLDAALRAFGNALEAIDAEKETLLGMVGDLQRSPDKSFEESQVIQAVETSQDLLVKRQAAVHFRLGRVHAARRQPDDRRALASYREAARLDPSRTDYRQAVALWEELVR